MIVGPTADNPALELRNRLWIENTTCGTRSENVALLGQNSGWVDNLGAEFDLCFVGPGCIHIRDYQPRPGLVEVLCQGVADFSQAGQGYGQVLKFGLAVRFFKTRPQATEDAPGRHGGGVSAAAKRFRPSDPEPTLCPDVLNIRSRRAHVFGWNIAARQRLYGVAQGAKYYLSTRC